LGRARRPGNSKQLLQFLKQRAKLATAYDGKDWAKSAKLYAQIVQTAPNPRAWYRLGVSLNKIGENDKAIEAFEKGRALGLPPQFAEYGIAAVFASKKDKVKAFEHLEKAAQNGLSQPDQLSTDPDLADLKSDARFAKILEEVSRNQKPCASTTENRQFDFWLGEWRVVTTRFHVQSQKIEVSSRLPQKTGAPRFPRARETV
jgi:tetratricopeptide (TPR) repeat protein